VPRVKREYRELEPAQSGSRTVGEGSPLCEVCVCGGQQLELEKAVVA
jgi:hypothetical protein